MSDFVEYQERYELVLGRIGQIAEEAECEEVYREFFQMTAQFFLSVDEVLQMKLEGSIQFLSYEDSRNLNRSLYQDILPGHYAGSYANPAYAVQKLGEQYGKLLCFTYAECRAAIAYAYEGRKDAITILMELFVEIYTGFCTQDGMDEKALSKTIYWFFHDYSELMVARRVREMLDPFLDFFTKIVMESDFHDLRYLFLYGEYISKNELDTAAFLNTLPEEQIQAMADTFTEGYRIGFEVTGKDLSIKKSVAIHYCIGFERIVRAAIKNFEKMGLKTIIFRNAVSSMDNRGNGNNGCYATSANRQFDYDHRNDRAFYLDKAFVERRLEVLKNAFEKYKELAAVYGGPAVQEVFGEEPFLPENKPEAARYDQKQQQLDVYMANQAGQIKNQYIKGEERSFTIIAYPLPAIGEKYQEIFQKTVELNTLDYELYRDMQQKLIDVLDQAEKVHIVGTGMNHTDLTVSIWKLEHPESQTAFENCVADVNIPVGEVFTSPVLKGTNGTLHVSGVYLHQLYYKDLEMTFTDGMVTDYTCANFESEEENKRYIHENVLMNHESLPMGEFAIGTNTTAYRMAKDYQIADKLPILIAEKTGPHFAVGDTCYSQSEDTAVYNPDGKEIMPRDNEHTLIRKEDPTKAYYNCHTDITIPYEELGAITAILPDGREIDIIRNGRFVVPGVEKLNEQLD